MSTQAHQGSTTRHVDTTPSHSVSPACLSFAPNFYAPDVCLLWCVSFSPPGQRPAVLMQVTISPSVFQLHMSTTTTVHDISTTSASPPLSSRLREPFVCGGRQTPILVVRCVPAWFAQSLYAIQLREAPLFPFSPKPFVFPAPGWGGYRLLQRRKDTTPVVKACRPGPTSSHPILVYHMITSKGHVDCIAYRHPADRTAAATGRTVLERIAAVSKVRL